MGRDDIEIAHDDDDEMEDVDLEDRAEGSRAGVGFLAGLVLGALLGAGAALLLAPERGEVTRGRIQRRMRRLRRDAADRLDEIRDDAGRQVKRTRRRLREHLPD